MPYDPEEHIKRLEEERKQRAVIPPPTGLSAEDLEVITNAGLVAQGIKEDDAVKGTLFGVGAELGIGVTASAFTKSGARASKVAKNIKTLINAARGVKTISAGAVVTPEPVSTAVGAVGFAAGEAVIWGFSNIIGQEVRKAYGIQDATRGSEVIAAAAFGILATPIDAGVVKAGRQFLNKRMPVKLTDDVIGKSFKTRELIVKGAPAVVSGAVQGMAETAMRQEVAILFEEEGADRNALEYLVAAGVGGGLNSVFHVFSKTGAFGRRQATKVTDRAVDRVKERINLLQKDLAKAKKAAASPRIGFEKSVAIQEVQKLNRKIKDELQVIALIEDFGDDIKKASNLAEKQEVTPAPDVVVKPEPLDEPKVTAKETEAPKSETVKEPEPSDKFLPEEKVDSVIDDFSNDLDELNNLEERINNGDLKAQEVQQKMIPAVINKSKKIVDAAEFDAENAVRKIVKGEDRANAFRELSKSLAVQIRVIEEVLGPLNNVVGSGVRANRKDVTIDENISKWSRATTEEIAALRNLKRYVDGAVADDVDEMFADTAQEYLSSKNKLRRNQRKKAREEAKGEQVVNLETRVKELEEKLAEKKAVAAGKPAKQPKTAKEKAEAQLEKEQQDFVEGKQDEAPKKAAKEEDAELQELKERIAFYKKNKKEAAEIEELEASIDRLSKLGKEGDPEKISKLVSGKPKWAGIKKAKSYLEDLRGVDQALRRELKKSLEPQKTPEEKFQDKIEAQKQKLQDRLTELQERAVGPKAKAADELVDAKPAKKEDTVEEGQTKIEFTDKDSAEVKDLRARIKSYDRFEKEAANYDAVVAEEQRLKDILKRGDADEMQQEVGRMPGRFKGTVQSKYDKAVKEVANRKKAMRTFLTKLAKQEERVIRAKRDKELYERYASYLDAAHAADNIGRISKFFRSVRLARKMALIDSLPSAQAAFPTGMFEMGRNIFKPITNRIFTKGEPLANKIAIMEWQESVRGIIGLFNGAARKHFVKTFKEARDPNYGSTDKFDLNTAETQSAFPTGVNRIIKKAQADAALREKATRDIKAFLVDKTIKGKFFDVLSIGMRTIMGVDAVFKRQLRDVAARSKFRQKAILEFPDDATAAEKRFNQLYGAASKDLDGVNVLEGLDELADEFALIDEALLMAASSDSIVEAKKAFINAILKTATKNLNEPTKKALGAAVEAFMPFLGVGVRSVQRMARFSGGVLFTAPLNPFGTAVKNHKREIERLKKLFDETTDKAQKTNIEKIIKDTETLRDIAEARRVMYNKESLTDAMVAGSLLSAGVLSGYAGHSTGTNAWMTDEQRARNKEKKPFTFFGIDIRAAVPFNAPLVLGADLGNFFRARNENKLSKEAGWKTVVSGSVKEIVKELPVYSGLKQFTELTGDNVELSSNAFSKLIGSYIPIPSQIRKEVEFASRNGTLNELRGENSFKGYVARVYYSATGAGAPNVKRDIFGEERESGKTWLHKYNRFASAKYKEPTKVDDLLAADIKGRISSRIPETINAVKLQDYRDENGYTLYSKYADIIKKMNVKREINKLVRRSDIEALLETDELRGDEYVNLGLMEINREIQGYYRDAKKDLLENTRTLRRFINAEGETADSIFGRQRETRRVPIPTP